MAYEKIKEFIESTPAWLKEMDRQGDMFGMEQCAICGIKPKEIKLLLDEIITLYNSFNVKLEIIEEKNRITFLDQAVNSLSETYLNYFETMKKEYYNKLGEVKFNLTKAGYDKQ